MKRLSPSFGKQCAAYGGIEFDLNPIEIYEYSDMIEYFGPLYTASDTQGSGGVPQKGHHRFLAPHKGRPYFRQRRCCLMDSNYPAVFGPYLAILPIRISSHAHTDQRSLPGTTEK